MSHQHADLPRASPLESPPIYMSFATFLEEKMKGRSTPFTKQELTDLRIEYRKNYHQVYYHERKKKEHRLTIRLTQEEYTQLKNYAAKHKNPYPTKDKNTNEKKLSLNKFVKQSALAYLEESYVPRDPLQVDKLISEIRKIGNNINQLVRKSHRLQAAYSSSQNPNSDLGKLLECAQKSHTTVTKLEMRVIEDIRSTPVKLYDALEEFLEMYPDRIPLLINDLSARLKK